MDISASHQKNYTLPDNTRIYAIGDIHGYYDALAKMHFAIDEHIHKNPHTNVTIVYLGDYIDRGPDSAKIIERLSGMKNADDAITRIFLRGNHEQTMLDFLKEPLVCGHNWLRYGGIQTLQSYGVEVNNKIILPSEMERLSSELNEKLPHHHREFCKNLDMYYVSGDYLLVHAGVSPKIPLSQQKDRDLMCIRDPFLKYEGVHEYRVVHGHSISFEPEILQNRIGIDTGYYESGILSAVILEGETVGVLQVMKDEDDE